MAALITRDLLGNHVESQELDLDLQVPSGWEKRLDLKSGKVYLQRCSASGSSSERHGKRQTSPKMQDLNFPPSSAYPRGPMSGNYFVDDDANFLDLKLTSSSSSSSSSCCNYQSVCTLDKVKSALERAEREPRRNQSSSRKSPSSSSSSGEEQLLAGTPVAAGCPSCLLYVLISRSNPRCPRCNSVVPLPGSKKPQIDLNISM